MTIVGSQQFGKVTASQRPIKEFAITVSEIEHELYPGGPKVMAWAFNEQIPGPTLWVTEGDLVRVRFTNKHTSNHTLHFHGLNVPNEMDGVAYGHLHHLEVKPGETRTYEFVAEPAGTHMYHCHVNSPQHIDLGMVGVLIVEPKNKTSEPKVDKQTVLLLDDWYVNEHGDQEPMAHPAMIQQANYFTVNGKSFPAAEPIKLAAGEKVRVRLINVGYQAHSMHLHGHSFVVTHRDGRPLEVHQEQDTLLIGPGERYDLVFTATNPGLWLFHCHVVPHVTNDGQYPGGLLVPVIIEPKAASNIAQHAAH
ncbi:MAG TPA: multicopper oxidase domain-containing protein [Candidatus Acidoferrales bacterium]|nr:multicopper oxidase domain-containing protein [Candidatus Acidoferrales bacterium]